MKRLTILLLVLWVLCCSVYAKDRHIVDEADLHSAAEELLLEQEASRIAEEYEIDVVILTVNTLGTQDPESYADDYYDNHDYGYGSTYSGVLFMLSMEYRDWAISTTGDGIYALTDYGIQKIFASVAPDLAQDNYYEAFSLYLKEVERYYEAYVAGTPIDGPSVPYDGPGTYIPGSGEVPREHVDIPGILLLSLGIGAVVGGIAILVMRSGMHTAKSQSGASSYTKKGLEVSLHQDMFLYSHTRRVRRDTDSSGGSGSGGGSRVHRSSSGRSHGGGHGKF